ncbi:MAG: exodeoxyribonuclease VII large subunit, partial [candidate division NC10 bacterium]|nr:exodeoxyribonuclease VII large subunit [candidate division NC10 bacterium]
EVDVTISDLVADLRAPTPSAAAEAVVTDSVVVLQLLRRTPQRLGRGLRRASERRRSRVADALAQLTRTMQRKVDPAKQALDLGMARLERRARNLTVARRSRLSALTGRLEALSPLATLARGYSVARTPDGRLLRTVTDFTAGLLFDLRVRDGTVRAETRDPPEERPDE